MTKHCRFDDCLVKSAVYDAWQSRKGYLVKEWLKFVAEFFGFVGFCDEIWRFLQLSKIILVSFAVFNARKTQHIVVEKFLEDFRYFS